MTVVLDAKLGVELAGLILILFVAVLMRIWQLDAVPSGLTHDEANNVQDAAAVLDGQRPFYFPVAQGKEPFYPYSVALTMALLGPSPLAMRLTSALWGTFLIVFCYLWARRAFGPAVALMTAAGLAVSFWPVSTARMGLRAVTLPVLFTAAMYFLWRGEDALINRRAHSAATRFYVFAGAALGGSLYTYLASRVMPLVLVAFLGYLALVHRRWAWGVVLTLAVAALVAMPLFLYLNAHPSAEIRIGQLDRPLQALLDGDLGPLLARVFETLPIFSFQGDTFIPYNLPGKPLLGPVMSVLFYVGLVLALWRWRQPAYALALLWLVVGAAPALVTGREAANLRGIAAQPPVYVFPALSLAALGRRLWSRVRPVWMVWGGVVLFLVVASMTYRDYFLRWADDRDVRVHYHADLVAVAEYVQAYPETVFVVSALYPGQYHDPRVVEAELQGVDVSLRWANGGGAWVLPAVREAGQKVAFIVPQAVPLDPTLVAHVAPDWFHVTRVTVRPDDFNPYFDVYRWAPPQTPAQRTMAQFGQVLRLVGAETDSTSVVPGEMVLLLTHWQVLTRMPKDRDAVLFVQVLDADGDVVAQQDRLDAPSWNWQPGDRILQLSRIVLPDDITPGIYRLILGVYTVPDRVDAVLAGHAPDPEMPRLLVHMDDVVVGDLIELISLEVVADAP